jgi:hypothetical protein
MRTFWLTADSTLRSGVLSSAESLRVAASWQKLAWQVAVFGAFYGAMMGTFALSGERALQIVVSALKMPLWLLMAGSLSLPLFGVLYSLWGLREDFGPVLRALLATQATFAITLASLSPLLLLCYLSVPASASGYNSAIMGNVALFGVAAIAAQQQLRRLLRPFIARDARHGTLLRYWIFAYSFVGIQMAWVLRPFIGDPNGTVTLFRPDALGNAYVMLWNIVVRWLGG